jgi:hypothetical protein
LKKGTFFFSGAIFAVFLQPEKLDFPFFDGLLALFAPDSVVRRAAGHGPKGDG